ncbi:hypothetical protein [Psychrobacter urativorans]|uniref:hypothetical protein n=1 Tax=Psychrobacter urativorans TaxID=45610 RepID=UPI001D103292|nr:hypothetical protein [Psychrobacter urativorans]
MNLKETVKQAKQIERQLERQNESTLSSQLLGTTKLRNYLTLNPLLRKGVSMKKKMSISSLKNAAARPSRIYGRRIGYRISHELNKGKYSSTKKPFTILYLANGFFYCYAF